MKTLPFKALMRERRSKTATGAETLLSVSEYYGVKPRSEAFEGEEFESRAETLEGYREVRRGDLVMNYMLAWKGAYGVSNYDGIVSPAYAVFQIKHTEVDPGFLHYYVRSEPMRAFFRSRSKGIIDSRLRLYPDTFLALNVSLPDRHTQISIADFLDRETARIDELIEKKGRILAVLSERRQAVAQQCLAAKGLSTFDWQPDRQSFVFQWGQPGWSAMRVKCVVSFMTSGSRGWSDLLGTEGEVFIQSGNIGRYMEVDISSAHRVQPQRGAEAERTLVRNNDVLVCITGGRTGAVGFIRALKERAYINQHVCVLRARSRTIHPELLAQILWSDIGQKQIGMCQYGVKQGLGFNELGKLLIPVPPRDIHDELSEGINRATARLDNLTDAIQKSVARLQELRVSLVTAAVTGDLDLAMWKKRGMTERRTDAIEAEMPV